jgi:nitrite reductase (NADH) large subunit
MNNHPETKQKTHVVIGTSAAGIGALAKLRALDKEGRIICISASSFMPYNTCLLVDYLSGYKTLDEVYTKSDDFFKENSIELYLNTLVTSINPSERTITCNNGQTFTFDTLFLGLGTAKNMPPIPGINECEGIFSFHTLEDAHALREFVAKRSPKKATIIGAGLSGVECSDALAGTINTIDLVDMQDQLLPSLITGDGSAFLESIMARHNITFHKSTRVTKILHEHGVVSGVQLDSGQVLESDLVIFTLGGKPNIALARDAGLSIQDGAILTNKQMQTSEPNIYAAGDNVLVRDNLSGELKRNCLWTDAMMQGMVAGNCMGGREAAYNGSTFLSSSKFFGLSFASCGEITKPKASYTVKTESENNFHHTFVMDGEKLKSFAMIGEVNNLGELRRKLIE